MLELIRNIREADVLLPTTDMATTLYSHANTTNFELYNSPFLSPQPDFNGTSFRTSPNILENGSLSYEQCDDIFENFTRKYSLVFDPRNIIRIAITWLIFVLSAAGNSFVLASVTIRSPTRTHSHSQIMTAHLTAANLAFTFIFLPTDAIWQTTKQWYGGAILCRLMNVLKQFTMYSSSAMVVVMGFDRVANLMCPVTKMRQRKRILIMLTAAWVFSLLNAIPAGAIFNVIYHPVHPNCSEHVVVQCVDLHIAHEVNLNSYYMYTLVISFFGPLLCILVCYVLIAFAISRMARMSKEAQKRSLHQNSGSKRGLDRARRVSLIVTTLISATFIICWGPYYVSGLVLWFTGTKLSQVASEFMLMSVYLNPMLHPLITIWLIKEIRDSITSQFKNTQKNQYNSKSPIVKKGDHKKNASVQLLPKNGSTKTKEVWL